MNLNIHSDLPERKDWRIGCIGSGFIISDCHLKAYAKAGFNPVTIASRTGENAAKCAEQNNISKVYDSIDQLLDDESIEVLDIAVPPDNQLEVIKGACARGTAKGILAQKPLGANYAEAVEVV
ncbi:MAG: Gfo/Idh/MocA family oxidoreductase, partial [Verrucomicrobiota bacterium]|nr:Gfo/Idh/MocA family oxidoreductase [Verrucomicrobiota bacterium]